MKIFLFNNQKDLKINLALTRKAIAFYLQSMDVKSLEVAVYFVKKQKIQKMHAEYFQDPSETDCISFPFDHPKEEGLLGEVFVCPATALKYAQKHKKDPYDETLLYIIHGLLHLIGFEDYPEKERIRMQKKEKAGMNLLKKNLLAISKAQLKKWA